eukprot:42249-Chlamydomonas_euryale.AAC.4
MRYAASGAAGPVLGAAASEPIVAAASQSCACSSAHASMSAYSPSGRRLCSERAHACSDGMSARGDNQGSLWRQSAWWRQMTAASHGSGSKRRRRH